MGFDLKTAPILVIDLVGFTSRYARREEKRAVLERLQGLLDEVARPFLPYVDDPWRTWRRHDTGDGYYLVFVNHPPAVAAECARRLGEALEGDAGLDMALRMVLELGDVETVGDQILSDAFCSAARLIDDGKFRAHLKARGKPWALAASRFFYDQLERDPVRERFPELVALAPRWSPIEVVDKHGTRHPGRVLGPPWETEEPGPAAEAPPQPSSQPPPGDADFSDYLRALDRQTGHLEIKGIVGGGRGKEARRVRIEEIYTPLRSRSEPRRAEGAMPAPDEDDARQISPLDPPEGTPLATLLPRHDRLLIVGQPGAGKTTFTRLVACMLARDRLGVPCPGDQGGTTPSWRRRHLGLDTAARLPILLRVSDLAEEAARLRLDTRQWILDVLERLCELSHLATVERRHWQELLESGGAVLLLDGLDEVADEDLRQRLFRVFEDACEHWPCPMVVTSRPIATERLVETGFHAVEIEPFGEPEMRLFVDRWVAALYEVAGVAQLDVEQERYRQSLLDAIVRVAGVRRLAANPVMMTCLCVVHFHEGRLPEGRARVYRAVIRWLLRSRAEQRTAAGFSEGFAFKALARLALAMVEAASGKLVVIGLEEAAEAIEAVMERHFRELDAEDRRREARRWLREECLWSGILEEGPGGRLRFWHLTFEEYLAARQLAWRRDEDRDPETDWWPSLRDRLDEAQWREVVDLFPVCLYDEGGDTRVDGFLERVLRLREVGDLVSEARVAGIVGRILQPLSLAEVAYEPRPDLASLCADLRDRTMAVFTPEGAARVPVKLRIAAAEALGRGGDPRFALGREHWLPVEGAGARLAKYPVTVEEYARFVGDGGYEDRRRWSATGWALRNEEGWEAPGGWEDQLEAPNRPVVKVSWWEAEAYCGWLSAQSGVEIRLPAEEEWLRVASPDGRTYIWGEEDPEPERANFAKDWGDYHVGSATPVGIYPTGDGAYGHCDLAGNVWEWSSAAYDDEQKADDPGKLMVLRGGVWSYPAQSLRAAYRGRGLARSRYDDVGFRVCCAAPEP